jgi:hypothetical protein
MRIAFILLVSLFLFVASADVEPARPYVDGNKAAVSASDIQAAITAARHSQLEYRPEGPVYRVQVVNRDEMNIYFGEHYGHRGPTVVHYIVVKRIGSKWQAWDDPFQT